MYIFKIIICFLILVSFETPSALSSTKNIKIECKPSPFLLNILEIYNSSKSIDKQLSIKTRETLVNDLNKLHECFKKHVNKEINKLKKPPYMSDPLDEALYSLMKESTYKKPMNYLKKKLSKKQIGNLMWLSGAHIPKSKISIWLMFDYKKEFLNRIFKAANTKNPKTIPFLFKYLLEYRYDFDEMEDFILPILGQERFDNFLLENLNSDFYSVRKDVCNHFVDLSKKYFFAESIVKNVLKIAEEQLINGDRAFGSCVFQYYVFKKRNFTKVDELYSKVGLHDEILLPLEFYFNNLNEEVLDKKKYKQTLEKLSNRYSFILAKLIFLNKIYPGFFNIKINEKLKKSFDAESICMLRDFDCLKYENGINDKILSEKVILSLGPLFYKGSVLKNDDKKIFDYISTLVLDPKVNVNNKFKILKTIDLNEFKFNDKRKQRLNLFIQKHSKKIFEKNSKFIIHNPEILKNLKSFSLQGTIQTLNLNRKLATESFLSPWFQKAVREIPNAREKQFFILMNAWIMNVIISDYMDEVSKIAKKLMKRWEKVFPNELNNDIYLQTIWLAMMSSYNDDHVSLLARGLELSQNINNKSKIALFKEAKSRFFLMEGNFDLAHKLFEKNFQINENKLLTAIKVYEMDIMTTKNPTTLKSLKRSMLLANLRLCNESMILAQVKMFIQDHKIKNIIDKYCSKHFEAGLEKFKLFAYEYLVNALEHEAYLIDSSKQSKISKKLEARSIKILNDNKTPKDLKLLIGFMMTLYSKNDDKKYVNKELFEYAQKIVNNKDSNKQNVFKLEASFLLSKLLQIALETKDKNYLKSIIKKANQSLNERTLSEYTLSSEGSLTYPGAFKNIFLNSKTIINGKEFDQHLKEDFYKLFSLFKFDKPEKLITNSMIKSYKTKSLTQILSRKKFIIDTLFYSDISSSDRKKLIGELTKLEQKANKEENIIKKKVSFKTLSSIQKQMDKNTVFLDFLTNNSSNKIAVFIIEKNNFKLEIIENLSELKKQIKIFKKNIKPEVNQLMVESGHRIFLKLLKPYLKKDTKKIIISPHSMLYGIPFHSLSIRKNKENLMDRFFSIFSINETSPWLGLNYEISITNNLLDTKNTKNTRSELNEFLGIGNPFFSNYNSTNDIIELGEINTKKRGITLNSNSFHQLPETEKELVSISKLPFFNKKTLFLGEQANEENVKNSKSIQTADVISFATHALVVGEMNSISEPGLLLTRNNKSMENGYLNMSEVAGLNLNSELVILSACNTGSSSSKSASPFSGLASAFLAAGSKRVLASHWAVEDKSTSLLMQEILKNKFNNTVSWSKAHLNGIKNFIKLNKKYKSPFFWGSFILFEK